METALRNTLLALVFVLGGCSTSSPGTPVDASDEAAPDTGVHDTGTDTADLDAGADTGEAAPGAGVVACGANECTVPSEVCCPQVDGGTCFPRGAAPCTPLECDQPGDCTGGTTCCYQFKNSCGTIGSTCLATCGSSDVGACFGLADCQVCVSLTCAGLKVTACGTDGLCCH
jgi:hypothetical protein